MLAEVWRVHQGSKRMGEDVASGRWDPKGTRSSMEGMEI